MANAGEELAEEAGLAALIERALARHACRNGCRFREGALPRIVAGIAELVEAEEICEAMGEWDD
jgi:hypothetical protein